MLIGLACDWRILALGPLDRTAAEARHQTELLIVSLIEKLCQMYDADPLRSKRLFSKICEQMYVGKNDFKKRVPGPASHRFWLP